MTSFWDGHSVQRIFRRDSCDKQLVDPFLKEKKELLGQEKAIKFSLGNDGVLRFKERKCVPNDSKLKKLILEEGHKSKLSLHPRVAKMYQDLKKMFWWFGMKKEVAEFVASCLTCQKA